MAHIERGRVDMFSRVCYNDTMDYHRPYEYNPDNLDRMRELRERKEADPESLSVEERRELQWLTFAQTNHSLKGLRGELAN